MARLSRAQVVLAVVVCFALLERAGWLRRTPSATPSDSLPCPVPSAPVELLHSRRALDGAGPARGEDNMTRWRRYLAHLATVPMLNETDEWYGVTYRRDTRIAGRGLYIQHGSVRICKIGKAGTKQWDKVFGKANQDVSSKASATNEGWDSPYTFVFYRDPLERFLSAYLDKCASWRLKEGHCQPTAVFGTVGWKEGPGIRMDPLKSLTPERAGLDDKRTFKAYVDTFPLSWNRHFFLQSTLCHGVTADFSGMLNATFHSQLLELRRRAARNPGFQRALTEIYNLPADNAGNAVVRRAPDEEKSNAADKVWQYFDGATTKRLLRYYGQDYIQLGLALPEWLAHIPYPEE